MQNQTNLEKLSEELEQLDYEYSLSESESEQEAILARRAEILPIVDDLLENYQKG